MKIKTTLFLALVTILNAGCDTASKDFKMNVEKVDQLEGFILKGISISGPVTSGCIANNDIYKVTRNGKVILETDTRILEVSNIDAEEFDGKTAKGDYVHLYLPDGKLEDVKPGDVISSKTTSCDKAPPQSETEK